MRFLGSRHDAPAARGDASYLPRAGAPRRRRFSTSISQESTALTKSVGGRVTAIRTVVDGKFVPARLLAAVPLGWVRHNELRIDLRPGSAEHLTVLLDQSHQHQVLFSTDSYEPQGVPYGLPNGRHEIDVLIDSDDDVPSVKLTLRVEAPGEWDGLNVWPRDKPEPPTERYPRGPVAPTVVQAPPAPGLFLAARSIRTAAPQALPGPSAGRSGVDGALRQEFRHEAQVP